VLAIGSSRSAAAIEPDGWLRGAEYYWRSSLGELVRYSLSILSRSVRSARCAQICAGGESWYVTACGSCYAAFVHTAEFRFWRWAKPGIRR